MTLNHRVPGSSPGAPTNQINHLAGKTERLASYGGCWGKQGGNTLAVRPVTPYGHWGREGMLSKFSVVPLESLLHLLLPRGKGFREGIIRICFDSFFIIIGVP